VLEPAGAWRFAALGGLTIGLAVAPPLGGRTLALELVVAGLAAAAALVVFTPGCAGAFGGTRAAGRMAAAAWLALLGLAFAAVGGGIGIARVGAIDAGALDLAPGGHIAVTGHVAAVPRRTDGTVRVQVATPDGRLLVEAPEPLPDLPVGRTVHASGQIRDPAPWEAAWLSRFGIRDVLSASTVELRSGRRGGPVSLLDDARTRAEAALGRGTDADRAALLRGFVLGQDDRIDPGTVEEFRRSGLSHLLAVSGQNVLLLALLAWPLLALLGLRLHSRLLVTLALIAVYVPVAGGGASIQRAGVMGAAGVLAALAGRPRSRAYIVLLATAATLALNPRVSGDAGWQLSFAAVLGIMLWARPLRAALIGRGRAWEAAVADPAGDPSHSPASEAVRGALADGVAVTVAATLATAPLIASQFGVFSVASLPANLLALPAVAPVMWLGMLAGLAGQLPWLPIEPLTWLAGALAGYVAQVASWLAAPDWAQVEVSVDGPVALIGAYAALTAAVTVALRWGRRRATLRPSHAIGALALLALAASALALARPPTGGPAAHPVEGLRVTVLDVGQGDAILLEPGDGEALLVDAGPADADVASLVSDRGVERLAAVIATHSQADHVGGFPDLLARIPTDRLLYARTDRTLLGAAVSAGSDPAPIAEGDRLRSGSLRVRVLWPPRASVDAPPDASADANALSLVLLARWRKFEILLTGDAEAELAPVDPGPVDVLKLAHHGSEDAGLERLLDRTSPRLAVVSVGDDNPYGHPAPASLADLSAAGVAVARTDLAGTLTIDVDRDGFSVTGDG
jgi:competence protein ComEC